MARPKNPPILQNDPPNIYTTQRFLSCCTDSTRRLLKEAWAAGDMLVASEIPRDALPVVIIMAGYGYAHGVAIVDDWSLLCERFQEDIRQFGALYHPDLWFASCIVINAINSRPTGFDTFHQLGIHEIWTELTGDSLE